MSAEPKTHNSRSRIQTALERLFQKHRIVFWYDEEIRLKSDFESVAIDGVEKVTLENNEFGLKYRMLREHPKQKFLVYKAGPQPADKENWLLDVQLAHADFRTDQASLWLTELELPYEFKAVITGHEFFFNSEKRRQQLKERVASDDTASQIRMKMLGICADSDARIDSVMENLLAELGGKRKDKRLNLIQKCNLDEFLWEQMRRAYSYDIESPTVKDFVIELFKSCYHMEVGGTVRLGNEALVFLKRWKDSRTHETAFEALSEDCASILGIQADLEQRDYKALGEIDYFKLIDKKVLSELASAILNKTVKLGEVKQFIRGRRRGHWYGEHKHIYEAVEQSCLFFDLLDSVSLELESIEQGIKAYTESLYQVDQAYRKFIYHCRRSGQSTLFGQLADQVCKHYTNSFLLPLSDRWQELVDDLPSWKIAGSNAQANFFERSVASVLRKNNKVYVIISDAMRFEIGEELCRLIRQEDRFDASVEHMTTKLPSYTQLGMAALLPHKTLRINADKNATVSVDGQSSAGTENRKKILAKNVGAALAVTADDIISRTKDECRELVRDHDVIYVYQDRIDFRGHKQKTEREVFEAAEEALEELVKVVRKLTSANATNLIVTADHGFIYQDEVEDSDYSGASVTSGKITDTDRRFVLGHDLQINGAARKYTSGDLGLDGDLEVAIPNSINRFRKSGSSTRFVHGGCTLQEIVIPLVSVSKRRESDVSQVGVDVLPGTTTIISTGQLSVAFYQTEPRTDKVRERIIRVGLYAPDGELISDSHELQFDLDSENPRERELKVRLVLSKAADQYNNQQVTLKLEEPVPGTSHHKDFKTITYTLRRSFTSDFD